MFYHYSQNNSGGSFDFDKKAGITHHVVIEAESASLADRRAESIGLYFDGEGDCPCCGNRWSEADCNEGTEVPSVYDRPLGVVLKDHWGGWMKEGYETVVHFADGSMKWYGVDNLENTNT